ncbi:TonB-dependent receptor [Massilia sp. YIM B04103]|uniref:TonB-dependent receptor n=1 Tax=Massilia sp. YIM B04103 TaxID=2963106 RepID=UPI00210D0A3E|nr:TonB-dependent receptor [Massilia sp. YIM B04103]
MKHNLVLKQSVIAVALAVGGAQFAVAQQAAEPAVQKVFVTGSNIKRAEKEGSSPIQTVNAKQIAASGANTVAELLKTIPAFGSGASFDTSAGSFTSGAATASLRGMGSSSTLVLLNGRRITASAYADPNQGKSAVYDLNSIPVSALERVEIFKDGASAVYGSDAIAGVINFITKSDYRGMELSASVAANDDGEFGKRTVSGVWGFGDLEENRFNALISFDVSKRDSTNVYDQKDVENGLYRAINGRLNPYSSALSASPFFYKEKTPGSKAFATTYADRKNIVNRLDCDKSQQITGDAAAHILQATDPLIGRTFCNYDTNGFNEVQSAGKDANILSRFTLKLNDNLTAFAEAGYSRTERTYTGAPIAMRSTGSSSIFTADGKPAQQYQLILPVGHVDNPFPDARSAVGFRMVNARGGSENLNESFRVLTGLKGTTGNWDWETGLLWNRSEREGTSFGRLHMPTLNRIVTEGRSIADTIKDPNVTRDIVNKGYAQVKQLDAKASTTLGKLPGGDIGLAIGGEFRKEEISLSPDALTASGQIIGVANTSLNGERNVRSAFVELRTPFLKNWEMDFAGRYDKYPGEKSFVPKVGSKWTINERVALRGSFAKGFRAPALLQVAPGGVQSFTSAVDYLRCPDGQKFLENGEKADCKKSFSSLSASTPDLKPEKSKSYSLGLILNPMKDLDVLVDWYRIKKTSETALIGAQAVIQNPGRYPTASVIRDTNPATWVKDANGVVIPNSGPIQQVNRAWVNQGSTEVSGLDFEVAYRKSLGNWGRLTQNLSWSHLMEFRRAERPGFQAHNIAGSYGNYADRATNVDDNPRNRGSYSVNWSKDVHSVTATVDYVGPVSLVTRWDNTTTYTPPVCYYGYNANGKLGEGGLEHYSEYFEGLNNCSVKSWTTVGVNYTYTGIKNLTLSFNVKNLFDKKAPYDPRYGDTTDFQGFDPQLHNGMGRYFRLSASYKF